MMQVLQKKTKHQKENYQIIVKKKKCFRKLQIVFLGFDIITSKPIGINVQMIRTFFLV